MNLNKIPEELAVDLLERSICAVQVAAVLVCTDKRIFAWGWNSVGSGYGTHAEIHAINRANPSRLKYSDIFVVAKRKRNGMMVIAKPCEDCAPVLAKYKMNVWWRSKEGIWRRD